MSSLACALNGVQGERVALTNVSVSAVLNDLLAEVTMCQSYRNEEQVNIEAVYTFPLPLDAELLELQVEIGGRVLKGVVVEKKAAEEKYEDAIAEGDAAVMLEQLEPGLYTMNVGNLLPDEKATIKFSYSVLYRWVGERLRLFIPTTIAARFGDSPHAPHQAPESSLYVENHFSLRMEISGSLQDAQFTCPSHQVSLTKSADKVVVSLKQEQAAMDRDFILNVKAPQASRSFAVCGSDGDGLAAVVSFQPFFPGIRQPGPLNLAIVIDCSGSMNGDSIEQAKKAIEGILDSLQPSDRITLIAFGSSTRSLWDRLKPCTPPNRELARHFAKQLAADMGGTQIGDALQTAYTVLGDVSAAEILLVTDGEVSSWKPVVHDAKSSGRRIFTVGVGNAVSEAFLRELAGSTGGECELVAPREGMAERVIRHFERMRAPRAKRIVVHWPDGACDLAPAKLGSVFDGDTVIASARFNGSSISGPVVLEVETETGVTARQELSISMVPTATTQDPISTVARFAASMRLKELDGDAASSTALGYRLVSSWTNWLVVAERPDGAKGQDIPAIRKVMQTHVAFAACADYDIPVYERREGLMRWIEPSSRSALDQSLESLHSARLALFSRFPKLGNASSGTNIDKLVDKMNPSTNLPRPQEGFTVESALTTFVRACREPGNETLFITDDWIKPRLERLRMHLSEPITADQAEALCDAIEKRVSLDAVIEWLMHSRLAWRVYLETERTVEQDLAKLRREQGEIVRQRGIEEGKRRQELYVGTFDGGLIAGVPVGGIGIPDSVREYPDFLSWWREVGRLNPQDPQDWSSISGPWVMLGRAEIIPPQDWASLPEDERKLIEKWARTIPIGLLYD